MEAIEYYKDGELDLYNLTDDISESENLAKKIPKETEELHQIMLE